jgi:hypothetical protein
VLGLLKGKGVFGKIVMKLLQPAFDLQSARAFSLPRAADKFLGIRGYADSAALGAFAGSSKPTSESCQLRMVDDRQ